MVAKLILGLNLIEAGMKVLENNDSDEQSVATTWKSLLNSLCYCKELLRKEKNLLASLFFFFLYIFKDFNRKGRRRCTPTYFTLD